MRAIKPLKNTTSKVIEQRTTDAMSVSEFAALKDRFAFRGRRLYRSDPHDGQLIFFVEHMGMCRMYADVHDVLRVLAVLEAR